ncbi:MAG: VOC family protein [Bryobacteraceae bacterium]
MLLRSAPYFPVRDAAQSAKYYEAVLGFHCDYLAGDPAQFAICSRDRLAILFRTVADPAHIRPVESQGGTWDAFFWVDDADALHAELVAKGARVVYEPVVQPYGVKEFAVRDEDGHVLGFGQQR